MAKLKTIGVGQCRVCKVAQSLLKSHICPTCRELQKPLELDLGLKVD